MKPEDDQELWDLLGKSSGPTLSPFFARNVVREVRQARTWRKSVAEWLRPRVLIPSAALALLVAAAAVLVDRGVSDSAERIPEAVATLDPQDYEVVADLDNLLAFEEEESLWEDT